MKIYLAASSAEIDRARLWRDRCVAAGIEVVSTWIENVERVGDANPRNAHIVDRVSWASDDLQQVAFADVLWLLFPSSPSTGAAVEFGYALAQFDFDDDHAFAHDSIFISGDTKASIFCSLGREYPTDEEAFAALVKEAKR